MVIKIVFILSFLFASLNSQDLKSTINEIISTNPIIIERLQNYNSTKQNITKAEAGYYPKIDLSFGVGVEKTDKSDATGKQVVLNNNGQYSVYQNSLKYTQNLFNGFETTYQVKEEEYRTISAAYSYIEKVNNTAFEMANYYIQVMKNQELLLTAKENVKINKAIFEKVQKLYNAGLTTLSEVNKIESSLALAKADLVVEENTILNVSYNFKRVLGQYMDPNTMIRPDIKTELPSTEDGAIKFALKHNPSILISEFNIKLLQATKTKKYSAFYPKIDIEVSQSMNKNLSAIEGGDNRFRAMAYLSYNIFNGFSDTSAIQKSSNDIYKEQEVKNDLKRKIIEGLSLSWAANIKLKEQLKYLIQYKNFSLKTLNLYSKEYDLGRRSLLDLLSAQNDFIKAKAQIIISRYNILYAKYRILDAMGALVTSVMGDDSSIYSNVNLISTINTKGSK